MRQVTGSLRDEADEWMAAGHAGKAGAALKEIFGVEGRLRRLRFVCDLPLRKD
jgi:hypothetical protein